MTDEEDEEETSEVRPELDLHRALRKPDKGERSGVKISPPQKNNPSPSPSQALRKPDKGQTEKDKGKTQSDNVFFSALVTGSTPFFIIIMGQTGTGKTSLCAQFEKPLFICDPEDQGILRLIKRSLTPEGVSTVIGTTFSKIIFLLSQFANGQHPYKTVILEGLFGLENLAKASATDRDFNGDTAKAEAYGAVTKSILRTEWSQLNKQIRKCLEAGFNVICTGHTTEKIFSNPTGPDYDFQRPSNTAGLWLSISRTAEAVLFMINEAEMITGKTATEDQALFQKGKSKGITTKIYFSESPGVRGAKNQWGITGSIDCGSTPKETYRLLKQKAKI